MIDVVVALGDSIAGYFAGTLDRFCPGKTLLNKAQGGTEASWWALDDPKKFGDRNLSPSDILNSIDTSTYRITHVWVSLGVNDYWSNW